VTAADDVVLDCRGVLFDFDGVLADSTQSAERAWSRWATEYSISPDRVLDGLHGRRSTDTVSSFLPEPEHAAGLARIEELEQSDAAGIRPIPGAVELLSGLPANWAIVTSGTPALLAARLEVAGLPRAPIVVTGDDVTAGKPAPDGYLKAAAALGIPISDCVVVEDAPAGIQSGRAAGAAAVLGVGELAVTTDADVVVRDLRGVTWTSAGLRIQSARVLRGLQR
jgi:sugar-phosphatase